jgi:hypothetical protein
MLHTIISICTVTGVRMSYRAAFEKLRRRQKYALNCPMILKFSACWWIWMEKNILPFCHAKALQCWKCYYYYLKRLENYISFSMLCGPRIDGGPEEHLSWRRHDIATSMPFVRGFVRSKGSVTAFYVRFQSNASEFNCIVPRKQANTASWNCIFDALHFSVRPWGPSCHRTETIPCHVNNNHFRALLELV